MQERNRILLIEDDQEIAHIISVHIADLGMAIDNVRDGRLGLEKALAAAYELVILDIMLPGLDGFTVCKRIREKNPLLPILMLTAKSEEIDRVLGLELGADDYLTKPFSIRELLARVKALLRRAQAGKAGPVEKAGSAVIHFAGLILDQEKRKVTVKDKTVELTVKEFELLVLFMAHPGRAYSRDELLNLIWGDRYEGYEHTVNSHINRLRMKIEEDPGTPRYLKTVWGVGYRFAEPGELQHA